MKLKADTKEIDQYAKTMRKIPKEIRPVIAKTLNIQAQDLKFQHMPDALESAFEIRDPKFMNRQLRFTKAKPGATIDSMFSEAGSVEIQGSAKKGKFTGWEEQQTGKAPEKNRVASQASRTGQSWTKKIKGNARMRNTNKFVTPKDFMGGVITKKSEATYAMLKESKHSKRTFMIQKNDSTPGRLRSLKPGIYGWVGGRLMRLQKFDTKYDPKKTDWMGNSVKRLVKKRGRFDKVFGLELQKALRRAER